MKVNLIVELARVLARACEHAQLVAKTVEERHAFGSSPAHDAVDGDEDAIEARDLLAELPSSGC